MEGVSGFSMIANVDAWNSIDRNLEIVIIHVRGYRALWPD